MKEELKLVLRDAIARNVGAVLSLPSAGMLRHCKSRFLLEAENGFWLESVPAEQALIEQLIESKRPVAVAFKAGAQKVIFGSPIVQRNPSLRVSKDIQLDAVCLLFPDQIKIVQRRGTYRVAIPEASALTVRIWRIPEEWDLRERPASTLEIKATLRDLSTSGLGATCPAASEGTPRLVENQKLRISLIDEDAKELVIAARMRYLQKTPAGFRMGVQFENLQGDFESRVTLTRLTSLVGALQRAELRRIHLGLTKKDAAS